MIRRKRPFRMGLCALILATASLALGLVSSLEGGSRGYENYDLLYCLGMGLLLFVGLSLVNYGVSRNSTLAKLGRLVFLTYLRSKRK